MTNPVPRRTLSEHFKPYKFKPATILHDRHQEVPTEEWSSMTKLRGGFNPVTKEMIPFTLSGDTELDYELDNITAALEAGVLNRNDWPSQLFSSEEQWDEFIEAIEEYFSLWRINDRWMSTLENLLGLYDEGDGLDGKSVADAFNEAVADFYQEKTKTRPTPDKRLELTKKQRDTLNAYNAAITVQIAKRGIPRDFASEPQYEDAFIEIVRNRVVVRPATMADIEVLMGWGSDSKTKAKAPRVAAK
jgi:hypothetical protein